MYPFLHLFGHVAASYYVCAAMAGILGFLLAACTLRKKVPAIWCVALPLLSVVFAIVGARLLNVLINPKGYGEGFRPWTMSYKNLSLMGGLALGLLAIVIFCRIGKLRTLEVLDAFVLPSACGIVILKVGCFLNGCCGGKDTKMPWGIDFSRGEKQYLDPFHMIPAAKHIVHPTQLYEILCAVLALVLAMVAGHLLREKRWIRTGGGASEESLNESGGTALDDPPVQAVRVIPGVQAATFASAFAIGRWIVLPYRALAYPKHVITTLYPIFYGTIALLGLGFVIGQILRTRRMHAEKGSESEEQMTPAEKDSGS